jgi:hypothetical protein
MGLSEEDVMVKLASLALHEHTHHFQRFAENQIEANEMEANRIAGYILITAKFVQLPLLKWTPPRSGSSMMQAMESLWAEVKAKEQEVMAPSLSDYAAYSDYRGQADRGVVRLFPREIYDGKMNTRGGGAYFSFFDLDHSYGNSADIELYDGRLSVGFAGCEFGYFYGFGDVPLDKVTEQHPAIQYLLDFSPARGEPAIRVQQSAIINGPVTVNGFSYVNRTKSLKVGQTFALRSINFENHDILVALRIIRIDANGIVSLAWKKLKSFPVPSCR